MQTAAAVSLAVLPWAGCSRTPEARAADPAPPNGGGAPTDLAAEVGGVKITRGEVDTRASKVLAGIRQQEYDARREALDAMVSETLLAKEATARGLTKEALVKAEVDGKVPQPTKAEVDLTYTQVQSRLQGRTREQAGPEIEGYLKDKARTARQEAFELELRQKTPVRIALEPLRWEVRIPPSAPSIGPDKAAVTIVEYLDYQCPYCRRAEGTVAEILKQYGDKVRFVHRDFPIEGHPGALSAARGTWCAGDQGKFWDFHKGLFATPSAFDEKDLRSRAQALGLNADVFGLCLASGRHDGEIRASAESGTELGVTSTPTFFINGRMVLGARPLLQFTQVIDEELARP